VRRPQRRLRLLEPAPRRRQRRRRAVEVRLRPRELVCELEPLPLRRLAAGVGVLRAEIAELARVRALHRHQLTARL